MNSKSSRLKEIDGLRAFAVLGVLWAHCWMFLGNIPCRISKLDINQIISFVGVGVDLFFVISGFVMYYTIQKKYPVFNIESFWRFVKNRWLRIAPVFYLAVFVYTLYYIYFARAFPNATAWFSHFVFLNTIKDFNILTPPFWSLATEWHFYLVLPLFFVLSRSRFGFYRTILLFMLLSLGFRIVHFGYLIEDPLSLINADKIHLRFIEFGWGILASRLFLSDIELPEWCYGINGFLTGFIIAYFGRILMVSEVITTFYTFGIPTKALAEPVMAFGFGIMIFNSLKSNHFMVTILNNRLIQKIGRVSYSFYLWHWLIASQVYLATTKMMGVNNISLWLSFFLSAVFSYYISLFTYNKIEKLYFEKKKKLPAPSLLELEIKKNLN